MFSSLHSRVNCKPYRTNGIKNAMDRSERKLHSRDPNVSFQTQFPASRAQQRNLHPSTFPALYNNAPCVSIRYIQILNSNYCSRAC